MVGFCRQKGRKFMQHLAPSSQPSDAASSIVDQITLRLTPSPAKAAMGVTRGERIG